MYNMGSLALFLIKKKYDEDSAWRIYIDILPESTDSTIFWWVLSLSDHHPSSIYSFRYNYQNLVDEMSSS